MSTYMTDVGNLLNKASGYPDLEHSTSRKQDPSSLDMTDFLNLMVVQLQNQTIDNTMDTSDMLNQMVQMQMITALTNMTDASVMSYASSLVGKEVTIGVWNNGQLEEKVVEITGTGLSNGKQVLFAGDEIYDLSSVMAVGRLPGSDEKDEDKDEDKDVDEVEGGDKTGSGDKTESTDKTETGDKTGSTDKTETGDKTEATDKTETGDNSGAAGSDNAGGSTSRELSDVEVEGLKNLLRSGGVDVAEDISNESFMELINGILSGSNEDTESEADQALRDELAKTLQDYLDGTRVKLPENYTEADLIKALEQLLNAQQAQNSAKTSTQARARRIEKVQLEEFT